ncbi:MAG: hypothetical protein KF680_08685 [Cryobacterium sp.]|nr:hypothetical protein [Cryobacterium sp.]
MKDAAAGLVGTLPVARAAPVASAADAEAAVALVAVLSVLATGVAFAASRATLFERFGGLGLAIEHREQPQVAAGDARLGECRVDGAA